VKVCEVSTGGPLRLRSELLLGLALAFFGAIVDVTVQVVGALAVIMACIAGGTLCARSTSG